MRWVISKLAAPIQKVECDPWYKDLQDLPLLCGLILCVSQMEVINTLLANNDLKAGQWLRPSTSLRSKSINENWKKKLFLSRWKESRAGRGGEGSEMNEVELPWSDCLNLSLNTEFYCDTIPYNACRDYHQIKWIKVFKWSYGSLG